MSTVKVRSLCSDDDEDGQVLRLICDGNMSGDHVKFIWPDDELRANMISSEYGWFRACLEKSKSSKHPQYKSFVLLLNEDIIGHAQLRIIDNTNSTRQYNVKSLSFFAWWIDFICTFRCSLILRIGFLAAFRDHYFSNKTLHGRFLSLIQNYLPNAYEINAFVVNPIHRKNGFGDQLFKYLLDKMYAKETKNLCNAPPIIINTFLSSVGFWRKMGFIIVGQRECFYAGDNLKDWCLIFHPDKDKLRTLQSECAEIWNENKKKNPHFDFKFPSLALQIILFACILSICTYIVFT